MESLCLFNKQYDRQCPVDVLWNRVYSRANRVSQLRPEPLHELRRHAPDGWLDLAVKVVRDAVMIVSTHEEGRAQRARWRTRGVANGQTKSHE